MTIVTLQNGRVQSEKWTCPIKNGGTTKPPERACFNQIYIDLLCNPTFTLVVMAAVEVTELGHD